MKGPSPTSHAPRRWKRILGRLLESRLTSRVFEVAWNLRHRRSIPTFAARPARPRELTIEVTNICNANCVFCGYQFQNRPKGIMPLERFRRIIDNYAALGGGMIELTPVVGDALVDRELEEKIRYARAQPQVGRISFVTNGILLTRPRFESLVSAGVTHLTLSLSGLDPAEYTRIYRVDRYAGIVRNLEEIAASPAFSQVQFSLGIRSDTLRAWRRSPDLGRLRHLGYTNYGNTLMLDNWSGRITTANLPGWMMVRPARAKLRPCWMLYNSTTVLQDGRMTACGCRDLDGTSELALGSIDQQPLDAPWRDGRMESLRQRFRDGNPPDLCRNCRHYVPAHEA